ncbi:unnamed protein product [Phytophthora lilii]|uniref:Unnamed protein product n=1 Tax=Phytophthora lilii TaxID=2077276 RepID=A0A9W7CMH3_9STRA|nr:unnamed protein product [Phytophthora lilii]
MIEVSPTPNTHDTAPYARPFGASLKEKRNERNKVRFDLPIMAMRPSCSWQLQYTTPVIAAREIIDNTSCHRKISTIRRVSVLCWCKNTMLFRATLVTFCDELAHIASNFPYFGAASRDGDAGKDSSTCRSPPQDATAGMKRLRLKSVVSTLSGTFEARRAADRPTRVELTH